MFAQKQQEHKCCLKMIFFFINAEAIMALPDIMKMYPSIDATEAVEKVVDRIR